MVAPTCDLEDLWQGVRCRFRQHRRLLNRARWTLYQCFYRVVRTVLLAGIR